MRSPLLLVPAGPLPAGGGAADRARAQPRVRQAARGARQRGAARRVARRRHRATAARDRGSASCATTSSRCASPRARRPSATCATATSLGALIIPEDTFRKIESRVEQPRIEVIVNEEDPLKARLVDDAIAAALAEANRQVARALTRANLRYLDLLLNGGDVTVFGEQFNVLGLRRIGDSVEAARRRAAARLARSAATSTGSCASPASRRRTSGCRARCCRRSASRSASTRRS